VNDHPNVRGLALIILILNLSICERGSGKEDKIGKATFSYYTDGDLF